MHYEKWKEISLRHGIWLLIGVYVVCLSVLTVIKYSYFLFHDFDLAVHAQIVWNILHGSMFNSILGINFLGNHANFVSFFLVPFYAVFPSSITLLVLQTVALGFSAFPLFLIAKRYLPSWLALGVAFLYLIYPGTLYTNLFEFHPTPFATFFLMWMLYYFLENGFREFCLYAGLAMLCQENISLIIVMMAGLAFIERRSWKWVLVPFVAGAVYFLVCVKWLIPYFSEGKIDFFLLYSHVGGNFSGMLGVFLPIPARCWVFYYRLTVWGIYLFFLFLWRSFLFWEPVLSSHLADIPSAYVVYPCGGAQFAVPLHGRNASFYLFGACSWSEVVLAVAQSSRGRCDAASCLQYVYFCPGSCSGDD